MQDVFNDTSISVVGKVFLAAIASVVMNRPPHVKLRGTPMQVDAIVNAILAAKAFQDELSRPGAMVQDVMDKLEAKNRAAQGFKDAVGLPWPL